MNIKIEGTHADNKPNEFIPEGAIITNLGSYNTKNLFVLNKILPENPWRFEPSENQPNAKISYEIEVEYLEFKPTGNYYGYNNQNIRLNLNNISGQEKYGQVRSGKIKLL